MLEHLAHNNRHHALPYFYDQVYQFPLTIQIGLYPNPVSDDFNEGWGIERTGKPVPEEGVIVAPFRRYENKEELLAVIGEIQCEFGREYGNHSAYLAFWRVKNGNLR